MWKFLFFMSKRRKYPCYYLQSCKINLEKSLLHEFSKTKFFDLFCFWKHFFGIFCSFFNIHALTLKNNGNPNNNSYFFKSRYGPVQVFTLICRPQRCTNSSPLIWILWHPKPWLKITALIPALKWCNFLSW